MSELTSTCETPNKQRFEDSERTFQLFSRLAAWDFTDLKEPEYSYVIVMSTYWDKHGTDLEKMYLNRLKAIWEKQFRIAVKAEHARTDKDFYEFQKVCKQLWCGRHREHYLFCNAIAFINSGPIESL